MGFRFLTLLSFAAIAGCTAPGPLQIYDGTPLPWEKIAVIQLPAYEFNSNNRSELKILAFDGRPVRNEEGRRPSELHVLPGVRTLTVAFDLDLCCPNTRSFGGFWADVFGSAAINKRVGELSQQELTLTAQAGRTYALRYAVRRPSIFRFWSGWKIDYWIEDLIDGKTVAGAKPYAL
jgi:hypothetical protein